MSPAPSARSREYRLSRTRRLLILVVAAALARAVFTQAAGLYFQNSYGLASPSNIVTFTEFSPPPNTIITTQYQAYGVTFVPYVEYASIYNQNSGTPNIDPAACVANFVQFGPVVPTFSIMFDRPVSAAAFAVLSQPGTFEVTALMVGSELPGAPHTFTGGFGPDRTTNFVGFSDVMFDELRISNIATPDGALVLDNLQFTPAEVNSWTNPTSARWDSPANWSSGTLPASNQTVNIANAGYKAVNLDGATFANFPASVTVSNLFVAAPTNALSTLLLNYAGLNAPLKVLNNCTVGLNGTINNFSSSFEVDGANGGALTIDGGTFTQEGGLTVVTPSVEVENGTINATNATMNLGPLNIGSSAIGAPGSVYQSGGTILSAGLRIDSGIYSLQDGGTLYSLDKTILNGFSAHFDQISGTNFGDVSMSGGYYHFYDGFMQGNDWYMTGFGSFFQHGGTAEFSTMEVYGTQGGPNYALESGTLRCGDLSITGRFRQVGGTLTLSNNLYMHDGIFDLLGGTVSMPSMVVSNVGIFNHFGGTNQVAGDVALYNTGILFQGGRFSSANLGVGEGASIGQQSGSNEVSGVLSITGNYFLSGGVLSIGGLYLRGTLSIAALGGTPSPSFINTGLINFGGVLNISASQNSMGQLGLSTNGAIHLGASSLVVRFADSSPLNWDSNSRLVIEGWDGSYSGNGSTQIYFGNTGNGLTPAKLSQIQFSIGSKFYSAKILATGEVVPDEASSVPGPINSWTSATSGNWDQATNWSQGVLPDASQSVFITNSGNKSVAINPTTPGNFPGSMAVSNLTIRGASDTENVLVLNSIGTTAPLTVLNGLTLQDNGRLFNFNSGLVVQGGTVLVTNSQMSQDGGLVLMTNAELHLSQAEYDITNGVFEGGFVWVGVPFFSTFNQYGGTVSIANLSLGPGNANLPHGGAYALYGGNLNLPGGLKLYGYPNNGTLYLQQGGTNRTTQVYVSPESMSSFKLNGGLLADTSVSVVADDFGSSAIEQNGGSHVITNTLTINGGAANGFTVLPATYSLNGGTLVAGAIELGADNGDSVFLQSNATTFAGTVYAHSLGYYSSHNTSITLAGGTLSCSNFTTVDGGGTLTQIGGALAVSNLLDFGGSRDIGGYMNPILIYGRYTFIGGTLTASNISLTGDWIIGDGSTNRIFNPGFFSLSHTLQISNAVEQLGRFILASNATINLAGSASRLSFANSSGEAWDGAATLVITNWNGNPSGGGAEQLKFGTDPSGLTSAQLSQIQFRIGSSTNFYSAKILATGEVVPGNLSAPGVSFSRQGSKLVLTWPAGWSLQTATNVPGPYFDIPGAAPPFTNDMPLQQQFFRLRQ